MHYAGAMIPYNIVYLTCSTKLTCSQKQTEKLKNKQTKNKSTSMLKPVSWSWRQSSGRSIKVERFVAKVGFQPGVEEWRSDGWWEYWWWHRWADKWMRRRVETWLARLTEWIWELIPEIRHCISQWAICGFQWGDSWWARNGNNG